MKVKNIETIIFDLDGVLVLGSNQGYLDCHHHALTSVGIFLDRETERRILMKYWSHPHEFQLRLFIRDDEVRLKRACEEYESYLFSPRFFNGVSLLAGAPELLKQLAQAEYKLGIATGMHRRQLEILFDESALDKSLFAAMISGYEVNDDHQKPHPYMLQKVMEALESAAEETIYVGDSESDVLMAQRAGVAVVAVLSGNLDRAAALRLKPDAILTDATAIPELLGSRGKSEEPSE